MLLNANAIGARGTTLKDFSCSGTNRVFLLNVVQAGIGSLWRYIDTGPGSASPALVTSVGTVENWAPVNGARHGCAFFCVRPENNALFVMEDATAEPVKLFPRGEVQAFNATPDGRQLFITGMVSNEPAAGIWQYNLATAKLRNVVPGRGERLAVAQRVTIQHGTFTLPTGVKLGYTLWRPPGYDRHRHRKYPLVLGNTFYGKGEALYQRSSQGPPWAPALAQCGAYVFVVRRASWMGGIEKWADNVLGAYQMLSHNLAFDRDQVYIFGASAETIFLNDFCVKHPDLFRGVMLLNPSRLIDVKSLPRSQPAPKLLISVGEQSKTLQQFAAFFLCLFQRITMDAIKRQDDVVQCR